MPTPPSGVHVRAGLYFGTTSRHRGSSGTAQGAPRYTSPSPKTMCWVVVFFWMTSSVPESPLHRAINARLSGSHGPSFLTDVMYLSMASCVHRSW